MKYAAVITWNTGEKTGATVLSDSLCEAWSKILDHFDGGERIITIELHAILTDEREIG